jgi:DNA-binding GntR family transcriptional regulator
MIIDHDSAVPVWRQVAAWLASQITEAGKRMPSESTIEQELGVSRGTVRHAYRFLADQGWVVIVSGKGAFAANPLPQGRPEV